jgi:hypothetical protein
MKLGRPSRTPPILKLAALGFFALAVGLFTVPHHIGFYGVFDAAFTAGDPNHGRALIGVLLIFAGLVLGTIGSVMVATTAQGAENVK